MARLQFALHGSKTRYRNFHITLAFLGDQPESALPQLKASLAQLDGVEMTLTIDRLGYFAKQKIAWAGMSQLHDTLNQLQTRLTASLTAQQVQFESRALFRPHITLAREADRPAQEEIEPIVWHAKQATLMQSVTDADGLQYQVLASHWLQRAR